MSIVRPEGYTREQGLQAVGKGWWGLVDLAFARLPAHLRIVQVKEKFGGLRIYAENPAGMPDLDRYFTLLRTLEERSYGICEQCGDPGRRRAGPTGWIKTTCDRCARAGDVLLEYL